MGGRHRRNSFRHTFRFLLFSFTALPALTVCADELPGVSFSQQPDQIAITIGGEPVATYYYNDPEITRPYFAHVRAPGGVQVTRHHPPVEGEDKMDHPTFHPGIWMTFGDISGNDYWRLKARTAHEKFIEPPIGGQGHGGFSVLNRYLAAVDDSKTVCEELCRYRILAGPAGYLLAWDSTFTSDEEFYFGDQEEMGLGIRVATPLRVEAGDGSIAPGNGTIIDAEGRRNGAEVGGNSAAWCDYSGTLDGRHVGITIFCHPENFRPTRFHARDYGYVAANAFGRAAFGKGPTSKVVVRPGEELRLRYGILLHSGAADEKPDLPAAYADYLRVTAE